MKIIPKPLKLSKSPGEAIIDKSSGVYAHEELTSAAELFMKELMENGEIKEGAVDAQVRFIKKPELEAEEYHISCRGDILTVEASEKAGAVCAVQTLRQLLFFSREGEVLKVPHMEITDKPRFSHRGLLFDVSRHFFTTEEVKRLIDLMALFKLNVLHWHLSDDQGWRVEIKKYPLLTEIGSKRKDSSTNGWRKSTLEGKPHEGYYTQEEIRDIVAYAAERNIMIIPEIDMPAHFAAAMAAYNYLGCREIPCEVHWFCSATIPSSMGWKDWNRSACAGKESTYEFIFNVVDEIAELFPAPYFHIGGDEAPKDEWKKCPECQKRMAENGLKSVEELQGWFNNRIAKHLETKGKRLIVWNEALGAYNLDSKVIGQYWTPTNDKNVNKHLEKGGEIIISKHQSFYFDMCYSQYPLKNTYGFEPMDKMISRKHGDKILGFEGALWTEWVADTEKADLQLFPRIQALAEIAWVPEGRKNFDEFLDRLRESNRILRAKGVNYARDSIAMPRSLIKRKREQWIWYNREQSRELMANRELKGKE